MAISNPQAQQPQQPQQPQIETFFDAETETFSYLVHSGPESECAVIDPVLGYEANSARTNTTVADELVTSIQRQNLNLQWILETHAHADHVSAAAYLQAKLGGKIAIGRAIQQVQQVFKPLFNLEADFSTDGSQFDHLFADGDCFQIGPIQARALHVPGHTAADMAYQIGNGIFAGDTLFMPDVGTARCDFPGGSAHALYRSIQRLLAFPPETELYLCHDYPPAGRPHQHKTTVAEQRAHNIHVHEGISEQDFVAMRHARDEQLAMPRLILPAVQLNIRAGHFPPIADNGIAYLKIPLNTLGHRKPTP